MTIGTIFSPITGRGGAVSVLRVSGAATFEIMRRLAGDLPPARYASLRQLRDGQGGLIDHALLTVFPAPHSFTGEDCAELSVHGGRAVLAVATEALLAFGARPAEPGEFSRRAFLHGKFDLLQAEAMADLIAAETQAQRLLALEGADALQTACASWREALRLLMAKQEALIDFPDEDLPPDVEAGLVRNITALRDEMHAVLAVAPRAERLRDGLEFVILGAPNAGKSTLLNALAGADIAIVSDIPGTTRDAVGVRVDLAGVPVQITDTAGLRETDDPIESEGVSRARARGARADLVIAVGAAPAPAFPEVPPAVEALFVITKSDLLQEAPLGFLTVSVRDGVGVDALLSELARIAGRLTDVKGLPALGRPRQVVCVRDAAQALDEALQTSEPELRGEALRTAATALGRLTGMIGVEGILDAVFSGFCIGK